MDAVSYSNAHVKAVGKDKAYTAMPVSQEIRDAQKREGQGQHHKIVPRKKKRNNLTMYTVTVFTYNFTFEEIQFIF